MIHVERITFYNGTDCNQAVTDLQVCGQPLTGSDTGLIPACNGKITCNESVSYDTCPGSKAAKLDYRCIPGNNVKDMCDKFIIDSTNRIFLSTLLYPLSTTFTDLSPCRCSILGSDITSIHILELLLHASNDGTKSSLEINYGDVTYETERLMFNKRLSTNSSTAEIILNHASSNRQYLWIELQGVSMRVDCTKVPTSPSPTKSPPTTTQKSPVTSTSSFLTPFSSSSSSSSSPSSPLSSSTSLQSSTEPQSSTKSAKSSTSKTNEDKDTTIIILAVLWSLMMCITAIIIIIIIVLLRRKKLVWVRKPPQVERGRNPYSELDLNQRVAGNDGTYQDLSTRNLRSPEEEGERSQYSGLDQNQRVSGNDGTYQELNTRNLTPQYYNVSQNSHPGYYNLN